MPRLTGISHVALTVSDLDRSQGWYERVFSTQTIFRGRNDESGFEVAYMVEPQAGTLIGLTRHDNPPAASFTPRSVGLDHLSFATENRDQVVDWAAHLEQLGVAHNGVEDQPFGTGLTLEDPDGIAIEVYYMKPLAAS